MRYVVLLALVLPVSAALLKYFEDPPPWTEEEVNNCYQYCSNDWGVYDMFLLKSGELICRCHSGKLGQH